MNFLGKTFGGIITVGAFLFAGVLLVTSMADSLRGISESENGKEADKDE